MNNVFIIVFLLIIGCNEKNDIVLPTIEPQIPDPKYEFNFNSNSGQELESVTMDWNDTGGDVTIINLEASPIEPIITSGNSYTLDNLIAGNYYKIAFSYFRADSTYEDTMQIFTRGVYPITNFNFKYELIYDTTWNYNTIWNYEFDNFGVILDSSAKIDTTFSTKEQYQRTLSWKATIESEFIEYGIYREPIESIDNLIFPSELNNIGNLFNKSDTIYIDNETKDTKGEFAYFYNVRVNTKLGFSKNSFIKNYTDFIQPGPVSLSLEDVSIGMQDYVEINWKPISPIKYFYQYEIYRALSEKLLDTTLLAIISDPNINYFQD